MEILLNTIALEPNRWTAQKIPYFQLEDLLQPITGAGFRSIEVWQHHVSHLFASDLKRLRKDADALGLSFAILGMYPVFHFEGAEREAELKKFDTMLAAADIFGSKVIKLMPGRIASKDITAAQWALSVAFVQEMLRRSEDRGLIITLETHGGTVADNVDSLLKFLRDVSSPRVKVCWQPFDFTSTASGIELFEKVFPHVAHLHLQGHRGSDYALLEDSDVDYRKAIGHMIARGFDGYLSIEFVKDCIVESPEKFRLNAVLENAARDRYFLESVVQAARRKDA